MTPASARFLPILDLRSPSGAGTRASGARALGARCLRAATVGLWGGAALLLAGPSLRLLPRLALAASAVPLVVRPRRRRRPALIQLCPDSDRGAVARSLGISETDLFRARHARSCIVHHDATGQIVALQSASLWICPTAAAAAPPAPLEPGVRP